MIPGNDMSTTICDSPACRSAEVPEVRTSAIMKCARSAAVVQIFCPSSCQPLSVRVACVRTLARSEPELGSLIPMQKNASPRQMRGRYFARCAAVP